MENKSVQVFYNSACPVCNAGINAQKGKTTACEIQWLDVHSNSAARTEIPADLEIVRERLHAIDKDGNVKIGIEAFLVIWRDTPTEKWKATLVGLPIIKQLSIVAYNVFARTLYKWNIRKGHWKAE